LAVSRTFTPREYGPFHRFQDAATNELMCTTGLIGGRPDRNIAAGLFPRVKARLGSLPAGRCGIEFFTTVAPDDDVPRTATWTIGRSDVVQSDDDPDVALIAARIVKRVDECDEQNPTN
jgi:hypothetical protein